MNGTSPRIKAEWDHAISLKCNPAPGGAGKTHNDKIENGIISKLSRARSSAAEQAAHNRSVVGSNPTGPMFIGGKIEIFCVIQNGKVEVDASTLSLSHFSSQETTIVFFSSTTL